MHVYHNTEVTGALVAYHTSDHVLSLKVGLDTGSEAETTYKTLLAELPSGSDVLQAAYETMNKLIDDCDGYVKVIFICSMSL